MIYIQRQDRFIMQIANQNSAQVQDKSTVEIHGFIDFSQLTLFHAGFLRVLSHAGGGSCEPPPLVSQLWHPKNSKPQFSQTDMVLSFHLSS